MISLNEAVHATAKSSARTHQVQNLGAPGGWVPLVGETTQCAGAGA
jgi:hypothetical protein